MNDGKDFGTERRTKLDKPASVSDDAHGQFPTQFFAAVRRRDAKKVREMAKQAGADRLSAAVRPLCDFLVPPSSRWKTPRSRKRAWSEARAAAVWGLERIGHPLAYPALARTLASDPDFIVREAARAAVASCGAPAAPALMDVVREQADWELDGMCAVLSNLAEPADLSVPDRQAAAIILASVLYENVPHPPRRWTRPARQIGRTVSVLVMIAMTLGLVDEGQPYLLALLIAWIAGQLAGFITKLFAAGVYITMRSRTERERLAASAADALTQLNNLRVIPSMLDLAFATTSRRGRRHARIVLMSLLPQVTQNDSALFSSEDLDRLNLALAQPLDPALQLGLLQAIEAAGNGASIRRVKRIARRARSQPLRDKAAHVLEVLEAREARLKIAQSLLRGAEAPSAPAGELLRAASARADEEPQQLLRAVEDE